MLRHLSIRNIVLVAQADIAFAPGLNALTGETGAGKSILLDALGLVLGERADSGLIRTGADQASVVAEFAVPGREDIEARLREWGMEPQDTLVIRRVMEASGRTRAFVNDSPVTVSALRQLAGLLVEQHSQHDQRGLLEAPAQRAALDRMAAAAKERAACAESYRCWREALAEKEALVERVARAEREQAYVQHMVEELKSLAPAPGEEAQLAEARQRLQAEIRAQAQWGEALAALKQPAEVSAQVLAAQRILAKAGEIATPIVEALERAWQELAEASARIEEQAERAPDVAVLEAQEERLFALRAAARKYRTDADGLAEAYAQAVRQLAELESQEEALATLEKRIVAARGEYEAAADALSARRRKAAAQCVASVEKELKPLKMDKARMEVVFEPLPEEQWSEHGKERISFYASANPGVPLAPLASIASGGELSRLMLALKVVLRASGEPGLYLFDEIDTGTGGAVAEAIGVRLRKLAEGGQVLVVTHAPQVAAQAQHHLLIEKTVSKGQTSTRVRALEVSERQDELARMLSGAEITDEARRAANRLLAAG